MLLDFVRHSVESPSAWAFFESTLHDIHETVRQADKAGFFDHDVYSHPYEYNEHTEVYQKPASVEEALDRCTIANVALYFENHVMDEIRYNGIRLGGWSWELVHSGGSWEKISVGNQHGYDYVHMCHQIAGLGEQFCSRTFKWFNY